MYVVYQHRRKDNLEIFYIGQGLIKRAYENQKNRRNENWITVESDAGGFIVDILETNLTRDESLKREEYYIKKYGTIKHGTGILVNERLSGTRGVQSGYTHTEEKKKEISEKTKKAMANPDVYKKHMASHEKYWSTPESRIKASNAMKGIHSGENHHAHRAINQYSLSGEFIKTWPYARLASAELNISASGICSCCKNYPRCKSAGGFIWKYTTLEN
jgi:hypothetical protein